MIYLFCEEKVECEEIAFLPLSNDEERIAQPLEPTIRRRQHAWHCNITQDFLSHIQVDTQFSRFAGALSFSGLLMLTTFLLTCLSLDSLEFTSKHHTRMSFIEHVPTTFDISIITTATFIRHFTAHTAAMSVIFRKMCLSTTFLSYSFPSLSLFAEEKIWISKRSERARGA